MVGKVDDSTKSSKVLLIFLKIGRSWEGRWLARKSRSAFTNISTKGTRKEEQTPRHCPLPPGEEEGEGAKDLQQYTAKMKAKSK